MYKFRNDIATHVPTGCLVEDYQTLQQALDAIQDFQTEDAKKLISAVMECLGTVIQDCTEVPGDVIIKPSPSSLIAMSCREGLLMTEDNTDFHCLGGKEVSGVLAGGVCQCSCNSCEHFMNGCDPENCRIALSDGYIREPGSTFDETLLEHLEEL